MSGLPVRFALPALGALLLTVALAGGAADAVPRGFEEDPQPHATHPPAIVELTIPSHGERLPGHIYLADGPGPHPTVILLHGFPGNEKNLDVAQALRRAGFNTLFFHYRGAWGGTGEFRFSHLVADVEAVREYLVAAEQRERLRVDPSRVSLLGHSLGGFTALAAGAQLDGLRCVMALSPANLGLWKLAMEDLDNAAMQSLSAYADGLFVLRGLDGASLREELLAADLAELDTRQFAGGLAGKAVLMIVGDADAVTPAATDFDPVVAAYQAGGDIDLTARILSGDHSFSWSRVALTREIVSWSDEHCRAGGEG